MKIKLILKKTIAAVTKNLNRSERKIKNPSDQMTKRVEKSERSKAL